MGLKRVGSDEESFLGELCAVKEGVDERPRYGVVQVPYDATTSYVSGASKGPKAVIDASAHVEFYDSELDCEPYEAGILTFEPLDISTHSPEVMVESVRCAVVEVVAGNMIPVILGGEHSVTLGAVKALKEKYKGLSIFQLDAHADMRDTYNGTPLNHACVARRISELSPITQVGVRSMSIEEAEFLKNHDGKPFNIDTFHASDVVGKMDFAAITETLRDDVFITIDLDVLDPSIMPSTGTPEPGGLGWYETLELLRRVSEEKNIVGFDVVELSPIAAVVAPDFLAAKLVYKLMAYINNSVD